MESKIYVGNLPFSATGEALRDLFAKAGSVQSAEIIIDRMSGRSKGFGFVQMANQAETEKAISMFNGYMMENRELRVNVARPKEEGGRNTGGGFNRRPGGGGFNRGGGGDNRDRRGDSRRY